VGWLLRAPENRFDFPIAVTLIRKTEEATVVGKLSSCLNRSGFFGDDWS
jgi:hypothetical protein